MTVGKIFHAEMPGAGDAGLGAWLDDGVPLGAAAPATLLGDLEQWYRARGVGELRSRRPVAMAGWNLFDVVHAERNILALRPPGAFVLTLLRDPVERAISLFRQHASAGEPEAIGRRPLQAAYRRDCANLPFAQVLGKWSRHAVFRWFYEDYVCRFFIGDDLPFRQFLRLPASERAERGLANFDKQVDAFGFIERMDKTVLNFSRLLGLYPRPRWPELDGRQASNAEFSSRERGDIEAMNGGDRILHDRLLARFDAMRVDYAVEDFERKHLANAMGRVDMASVKGRMIYTARAALFGDGFWPREGEGASTGKRWSGPQDDSTLYVPSFAAPAVSVSVHVREWANSAARASFRVAVWGEPTPHVFEPAAGASEIVRFRAAPRDGVLKLQFHAAADREAEREPPAPEERRKGFSFTRIAVERG